MPIYIVYCSVRICDQSPKSRHVDVQCCIPVYGVTMDNKKIGPSQNNIHMNDNTIRITYYYDILNLYSVARRLSTLVTDHTN